MSRTTIRRLAAACALGSVAVLALGACGGSPSAPAAASSAPAASSSAAASAAPSTAATSAAASSSDSAVSMATSSVGAPSVKAEGTPVGAPTTWKEFETAIGSALGVTCADVQVGEAGTELDDTTISKGKVYMARCIGSDYKEKTIGAVFFENPDDVKDGLASMVRASVGKTSWIMAEGQWGVLVNKSKDEKGELAKKVQGIVGGTFVVAP